MDETTTVTGVVRAGVLPALLLVLLLLALPAADDTGVPSAATGRDDDDAAAAAVLSASAASEGWAGCKGESHESCCWKWCAPSLIGVPPLDLLLLLPAVTEERKFSKALDIFSAAFAAMAPGLGKAPPDPEPRFPLLLLPLPEDLSLPTCACVCDAGVALPGLDGGGEYFVMKRGW